MHEETTTQERLKDLPTVLWQTFKSMLAKVPSNSYRLQISTKK